MANGKVYVFNCYHDELGMDINGNSSGELNTISGWSTGGFKSAGPQFTPASKSHPIMMALPDSPDVPVFLYGQENILKLSWIENDLPVVKFNMPGTDDGVNIEDDVIIYVSRNAVIVLNNKGEIIGDPHFFTPPA